jgi:3'-phosphoadenosine 5'-phosphosulfate sulfotransferase (PAPS reductase)/FAD synthetase
MSDTITNVSDIAPSCTDFALFSGGNDSVVSTHVAQREYDIDWVVYLDTNTGLDANLEHVKEVCKEYDWDLAVISSPMTLEEFAVGSDTREPLGFPGPGIHSWAYQYFKERQLREIATHVNSTPTFYTGVRSHESTRRMKNVEGGRVEAERWIWVSPIHDWRDSAVDTYRNEHDLPINPVTEKIGRSGDCYCGAYANRSTELAELEAHYPDHAEWIKQVEQDVQEQIGTDDEYCYWGFGGLSEKELRAKMAQDDMNQMSLCSHCDVPEYPKNDKSDQDDNE